MGIAVLRARVRRFGEQPSRGGSRALRDRVEKAVVVCREQRSRARERQIGRSILKEDDGAEEVEATMGMLAKMQAQVAAHMARLRGATKW